MLSVMETVGTQINRNKKNADTIDQIATITVNGLEQGKVDGNDDRELSILEQMNELEGDAQATFYKENKQAILALHALKK